MPPSFTAIITTAATNFSVIHQTFLDDEETAKINTETKIRNNNLVYDALMSMFLDGQEIFRNQEAILDQFIFDQCLLLVSGAGTAGVRGIIKNATTNQPIALATITLGADEYSTISEPDGNYQISPTAAGTYTLSATATGYQPLSIPSHVILTGTISTLNLLMNPIIEPLP